MRIKFITRAACYRLAAAAAIFAIFCVWSYFKMLKMPGKTYTGPLPDLTEEQIALREELRRDIETLAGDIGPRNIAKFEKFSAAADFLESELKNAGYQPKKIPYKAGQTTCFNIEAELKGTKFPDKIIIIGAHYDTVPRSPGANDNGTGLAATLALARRFHGKNAPCTIRFVFFANEEPPFYHSDLMGSYVYAKNCKKNKDNITAMLSLETLGYYTDEPNSQHHPFPLNFFYPHTGNFVAFVSNLSSQPLLRKAIASFREHAKFPSEAGAFPGIITGIVWSDHWSFYKHGFPAIMVTDTALFRYPYYHSVQDTPDKINYDHLTLVTDALIPTIKDLSNQTF